MWVMRAMETIQVVQREMLTIFRQSTNNMEVWTLSTQIKYMVKVWILTWFVLGLKTAKEQDGNRDGGS